MSDTMTINLKLLPLRTIFGLLINEITSVKDESIILKAEIESLRALHFNSKSRIEALGISSR